MKTLPTRQKNNQNHWAVTNQKKGHLLVQGKRWKTWIKALKERKKYTIWKNRKEKISIGWNLPSELLLILAALFILFICQWIFIIIKIIMTNKVISIAKKSGSIVLCRKNIRDNSLYDYEVLMVERKVFLFWSRVNYSLDLLWHSQEEKSIQWINKSKTNIISNKKYRLQLWGSALKKLESFWQPNQFYKQIS